MPALRDPLGLVGTIVDAKYRVERVVGEGGFGVVYGATHLLLDVQVALKCCTGLAGAAEDTRDTLLALFRQEGKLLTELSSRTIHIVQARDIGAVTTPDGRWVPYLVLEWLEGRSLDAWIDHDEGRPRSPRRTPQEAFALMDDVARALALAHRRGVVHRDLKPSNFFVLGDALEPDAVIKVLDFGIAKVMESQSRSALQRTRRQISAFSPQWAAPEQWDAEHGATGPWTDVYQMALILVEILRGGLPALTGERALQLMHATMDKARRPTPRRHGVEVSDAIEEVFARALALAVDDRYPNMGAFWSALAAALERDASCERAQGEKRASAEALTRTVLAAKPAADAHEPVRPSDIPKKPAHKVRRPVIELVRIATPHSSDAPRKAPSPPPTAQVKPTPQASKKDVDVIGDAEFELMLSPFRQFEGVVDVALVGSTGKVIAGDMRNNSMAVTLAGFCMRSSARITRALGYFNFEAVAMRSTQCEHLAMLSMGSTMVVASIAPPGDPETFLDVFSGVDPTSESLLASTTGAVCATPRTLPWRDGGNDEVRELLAALERIEGVRAAMLVSVVDGGCSVPEGSAFEANIENTPRSLKDVISKTVRCLLVASATVGAPVADLWLHFTFASASFLIIPSLEPLEDAIAVWCDQSSVARLLRARLAALVRAPETPDGAAVREEDLRPKAATILPLAPETPDGDAVREAYYQEIFAEFLMFKAENNESTEGFSYHTFASKLREATANLMKHPDVKDVQFSVYLNNGKVALKARVTRHDPR